MPLSIGDNLPDRTIATTKNENANFSDYLGKKLVVYFYPKDNTPGCTQEGKDFSDNYSAFIKTDCEILGVSSDSIQSHQRFIDKFNFFFALLSDQDGQVCKLFDVIKEKNMYGRKVMGIERSTFLFDSKGVLIQEWRKIRVKDHVSAVLEATLSIT